AGDEEAEGVVAGLALKEVGAGPGQQDVGAGAAFEDVAGGVAGDRVGVGVAGAVGGGRAEQGQQLDVGGEGVSRSGGGGRCDVVGGASGGACRLLYRVGARIDHVGVVAGEALEDVDIASAGGGEDVRSCIAGDGVDERVAGGVGRGAPKERQQLDVGGEGVG